MDDKIWRCPSKHPLYELRFNLKIRALYDNIHVPIQILYFIIFYCFIDNLSIEKAYNECNNSKFLFKGKIVSKNAIIKKYMF